MGKGEGTDQRHRRGDRRQSRESKTETARAQSQRQKGQGEEGEWEGQRREEKREKKRREERRGWEYRGMVEEREQKWGHMGNTELGVEIDRQRFRENGGAQRDRNTDTDGTGKDH